MTSIFNLKANSRTNLGSPESRRIRKAGQVPAVIYGANGQNVNISVDAREFNHQYFKGHIYANVAEIELDGKKLQAIPYKIELNPVTDNPEHIDFREIAKGKPVVVKAKLNFTNKDKSIGLKRGGFLHVVLRRVNILCPANSILETIDVDTTHLKVGSKIVSDDLKLPEGVSCVNKKSFLIGSIIGRGGKDDDKAEGTEAAPAAAGKAAPAAAGKAAPAAAGKKPADKK